LRDPSTRGEHIEHSPAHYPSWAAGQEEVKRAGGQKQEPGFRRSRLLRLKGGLWNLMDSALAAFCLIIRSHKPHPQSALQFPFGVHDCAKNGGFHWTIRSYPPCRFTGIPAARSTWLAYTESPQSRPEL